MTLFWRVRNHDSYCHNVLVHPSLAKFFDHSRLVNLVKRPGNIVYIHLLALAQRHDHVRREAGAYLVHAFYEMRIACCRSTEKQALHSH